jgi:hypothetical protein
MGWPVGYYLWCRENPRPDRLIERIEFVPKASRFIIAGVTTSDLDEHPFETFCGAQARGSGTRSASASYRQMLGCLSIQTLPLKESR